jgi:hypothetical protein
VDLAAAGVKVIAAGDEVPITKYATQLVDNLAKESGYPADFAAGYAANVVSKEDNVKAVVAKVETAKATLASCTSPTRPPPASGHDRGARGSSVPAAYAGVVVRSSTWTPPIEPRVALGIRRGRRRVVRLRASRVMIGGATGSRPPSLTRAQRGPRPLGSLGLLVLARLFALFLALPVLTLVARAVLDGSLRDALGSPVVLDALVLASRPRRPASSSPSSSGCRSPSFLPGGPSAARRSSRLWSTCPSSCPVGGGSWHCS